MQYIWIRMRRRPLVCVAIFLFAAVVALVLCGLHRGNLDAQTHYDDIYNEIDVRCTVTNLTGTQSDRLEIYPDTIALFTDQKREDNLLDLLEDVQIKGSLKFRWGGDNYTLEGITSPQIESRLLPENGCTVTWNDGADEGIFSGSRWKCIIPQELMKLLEEMELPTDIFTIHMEATPWRESERNCDLEIVGIYEGQDTKTLYCSWSAYVFIVRSMGDLESADAMYATLRDNRELDRLRDRASKWFAQPDRNAAGLSSIDDYYLALDINDSQLEQAKQTLENSLTVNRIVAILVFCLSAGAGAFVGFLMIRSRKQDIVLMRTMGTPDGKIYFSFAVEQMIFVLLGALAGGAGFRWTPVLWLALFVCVYFVGLSAALVIMLRGNLLTTIKEEE